MHCQVLPMQRDLFVRTYLALLTWAAVDGTGKYTDLSQHWTCRSKVDCSVWFSLVPYSFCGIFTDREHFESLHCSSALTELTLSIASSHNPWINFQVRLKFAKVLTSKSWYSSVLALSSRCPCSMHLSIHVPFLMSLCHFPCPLINPCSSFLNAKFSSVLSSPFSPLPSSLFFFRF